MDECFKKILSIPLILTCIWLFWVLLSQSGFITSGKNLNWHEYSHKKIEQALINKQPIDKYLQQKSDYYTLFI